MYPTIVIERGRRCTSLVFGLTNFGLPIIMAWAGVFTLYVLSFFYSPLKQLFHIFSSFSDKHPWMAKWGSSFVLEVIWLCFVDAHVTLSSYGLAFLSFFLIFFLGFSSIGLFEIILKDWNFFRVATAVLTAWLLLYVIYVFLSVWIYWETVLT